MTAEIREPDNRAWSPGVVAADPSPEIPGDEDFGERVTKARETRGMTQRELAGRVGISQPAISAIEAGESSKYIPDVCRVLKIPGPMFGWERQQQEWAILGHELDRRSPANFKFTLNNLKQLLGEMQQTTDDDKPPPEPPPKKKATPIGRANVVEREPSRRLRAGDELPGETKKQR